MDPTKDLAVYGYGTVTWKDRLDEWKQRQSNKLQMVKAPGGDGWNGDEIDDSDLPMYVFCTMSCTFLRISGFSTKLLNPVKFIFSGWMRGDNHFPENCLFHLAK